MATSCEVQAVLPNGSQSLPFLENDVVRYIGTSFRNFTVARCYVQTVGDTSEMIVEEWNADTHIATELELVRRGPIATMRKVDTSGIDATL